MILQNFVAKHGDHFLHVIKNHSQELHLSLDGEAETTVQSASGRKLYTDSNQQRKLTPAKFEAWRMWQEDGLSLKEIAVSFINYFHCT